MLQNPPGYSLLAIDSRQLDLVDFEQDLWPPEPLVRWLKHIQEYDFTSAETNNPLKKYNSNFTWDNFNIS